MLLDVTIFLFLRLAAYESRMSVLHLPLFDDNDPLWVNDRIKNTVDRRIKNTVERRTFSTKTNNISAKTKIHLPNM